MKHTMSYFRYRLKISLRGLIFISVIALVFCFITSVEAQAPFQIRDYDNFGHVVGTVNVYSPTLAPSVIVLCILCYITPVWQFAFFKKRRNLDCAYSLPITKCSLAAVHYAVGLIAAILPFTLCYIQNLLMLVLMRNANLDYTQFLPHYLFCLLFGLIIYNLQAFAFNEGNTVGDGIVFMTLHSFAPSMLVWLSDALESDGLSINWFYIAELTSEYADGISGFDNSASKFLSTELARGWLAFWIASGIVSVTLLFVGYRLRKTEHIGEVSDSVFGYRVMIPYFTIITILLAEEFVLGMILVIIAIGGYAAYRRGFRFKIGDWVMIGLMQLAALAAEML